MEPDFAYGTGAVDATPPLETIASIADEAERAATYISAFITRFRHGSMPEAPPNSQANSQVIPVPSGYNGQIARLRDAVASVDKLARDLQTIG